MLQLVGSGHAFHSRSGKLDRRRHAVKVHPFRSSKFNKSAGAIYHIILSQALRILRKEVLQTGLTMWLTCGILFLVSQVSRSAYMRLPPSNDQQA